MKFAEAHGHFATAAKLLEEEIGEKGASQVQETQIIKVVEGEGGDRKWEGRREREREKEGERVREGRKGGEPTQPRGREMEGAGE